MGRKAGVETEMQKADKANVFVLDHDENESDLVISYPGRQFNIFNKPRYIFDSRNHSITADGVEFRNVGCMVFNF